MTPALSVRDLSVSYGGVRAVVGVDLDVEAGEFLGLIGPNGAGKTTCIDAISGFTASRGSVSLSGVPLDGLAPHRRARLGLGRTWQTADVFHELTVRESLAVAAVRPRGWAALRELVSGRRIVPDTVDETLEFLGLSELGDAVADELSQGQRKLVDVARALAAEPKVLCLDEPAAGLDTAESAALGERLRAIANRGVALLLVDHDMALVLGACNRVTVLDFGQVIASGTPEQVREDPKVLTAYLGERKDPSEATPAPDVSASTLERTSS